MSDCTIPTGSTRAAAPTNYSSSKPEVFETYTDFVQYVAQRKCPKCNTAFIEKSSQVTVLFKTWCQGKEPITSKMKCRKCSHSTCIACYDKEVHRAVERAIDGTSIVRCCSRGRLFMTWILLCGFDVKYCSDKRRDAATTSSKPAGGAKGKGTGYGSSMESEFLEGVGHVFGGITYKLNMKDKISKNKALSAERKEDVFDRLVFLFLKELLPSPDHSTSFDIKPPNAVVSILVHSRILHKAAELLRNDSLDDATKRSALYMAMLDFVRNIGAHEDMSKQAMFGDRVVLPEDVNLLTLSFQGAPSNPTETASSLAVGLRNLNIQSELMLRGARNAKKEFADQKGQDLLWLCRKISDLSTYLLGKDTAHAEVSDHGCCEVADDQIWPTYYYTNQVGNANTKIGRMRRLIMEITKLKTGLSWGIYVKHAMSRLDVMKILIIGAEGTPYENGMYEFDLLCPPEFPNKPPLVWFKGTSGGRLWINPNLHVDGKVCLSLLGTFMGEPWRPDVSTILQVLISIQAMIFCEDPIGNIPRDTENEGFYQGDSYNKCLQGVTAKYAILEWARTPPLLWKDEVKYHLNKNGNSILKTVERWAVENRSAGMSRVPHNQAMWVDIRQLLPELQQTLKSYGATYVPQRLHSASSQQPQNSQREATGYHSSPRGGVGNRDMFNDPSRRYGPSQGRRF